MFVVWLLTLRGTAAPAADVTATPLTALVAVCVVLAVVGTVSLRRRDLALPA
ncbi:hypothetical protein [Streptomyces ureilyticus]|uniref:Uncharacterized protein n=1 Tax=Streptomyces ureilyticus TaxID=1775131 RepID=A0ABX0DZD4_9ACTN|nr:hypothetical protein [Streptomyces ureilyticus]NGO47307.1 hypothetical protein [Streptomyces ureilyticus]